MTNHLLQGVCEGDIWRGRRRRSIGDEVFESELDQIMMESQGLLVEKELVVEERLEKTEEATDFSDNIGLCKFINLFTCFQFFCSNSFERYI